MIMQSSHNELVFIINLMQYQIYGFSMKQFLNFLIYLLFFIIAFTLLKYAEVLEFDEVSRPGIVSRFLIALIVLIAVTRWGVNLMNRFKSK